MLPRNSCLGLIKLHPYGRIIYRAFAEQQLVKAKKTGTSLKSKILKKPNRPPFMKNIFLGIFDHEMLVYPELDKVGLEELKKKVEPYREYFKNNVDSKSISDLNIIPNEIINNLKNLGLYGQIIPTEYGGCDQSAVETAFISEITAKDLNVALTLYSHNFLAVQSLVMYGSSQQKEKFLPLLASGDWTAAFCLSEKVSGSDLCSLLTTVAKSDVDPEVYLLNGKKSWVVNGKNANLFIVLAKFDFKSHTGHIVPVVRLVLVEKDSPGVTVGSPQEHIGLNASNISEVSFKDTPVHSNYFIGGEVQGFEITANILNSGRFNIGAISVSMLKELLHVTCDFLKNRTQFAGVLIDNEIVQDKVTSIATCIYTLESMTYLTALILDIYDNPDCSLEQAIVKVFSFTEGRRCLDLIMELMGARAFTTSDVVQNYFRDFRTLEVFDGTTDVAKLFISLMGLQYAAGTFNDKIRKLRFPFEYPSFIFKRMISSRKHIADKPVLNLKLFENLHPSLTDSANALEYCVLRFEYAVAMLFGRYGADITKQQIELFRLSDAVVKIYAMTAVLGRASRAYCIGLPSAEIELKYASRICFHYKELVRKELNELIDGHSAFNFDLNSLKFGADIFRKHGYYLEHPLQRSY